MADLDKYDEETLYLAFWLQDKIYREGIEGIHYMDLARGWAEHTSHKITAKRISQELRKL